MTYKPYNYILDSTRYERIEQAIIIQAIPPHIDCFVGSQISYMYIPTYSGSTDSTIISISGLTATPGQGGTMSYNVRMKGVNVTDSPIVFQDNDDNAGAGGGWTEASTWTAGGLMEVEILNVHSSTIAKGLTICILISREVQVSNV